MRRNRNSLIALCVVMMILSFICFSGSMALSAQQQQKNEELQKIQAETTQQVDIKEQIKSYKIKNVPVIAQVDLKAGCEVYAGTMLMQYLGFDIDEVTFADNYLICEDVSYDNEGNRYGPDLYSAFAGNVHNGWGWGIYCTAMAKSMNNYFKSENSKLVAKPLEGVPLEELCYTYVIHDIPVMIWGTTNMDEAYETDQWIIDYTDENAKYKKGDTFTWLQNEHCLVLIGFDEKNYYFCDSCAGDVSVFDRKTSEERYKQISMQAIVVE